jgi:phosphoenolpyruvate phosphomutase
MTVKKTTRLKRLIERPELAFAMEAHNGLSARVVEEAGFECIWASGLAMAAAFGVRDSNEASWTQVLEVAEFMSDATSIPILLDGDAGYGNFNTMRRLVAKLEQRGIAGVCIEDKVYPKTNSLLRRTSQALADADEFAGSIRAGKGAQCDPDFVLVARVEALIVGAGLREALRRAEIYRRAGADAILIHSALDTADEVLAFKREWGDRHPVVIIPTTYGTTPTDVFRTHGFALCIWANQLMRAALHAMQGAARRIHADQSVAGVEADVALMTEVFRILGEDELAAAERLYLPARSATARRRTVR